MKDTLNKLFEHQTLSKEEARQSLSEIARGEHNNSLISAFLTVFLMRKITAEELGGFRDAMLELCIPVDLNGYDGMEMCGTGGDGKDTFNISTLSSFVVAGAGQNVAKHGNNGVSSSCGSSNILNHFGYQFTNDVERLKTEIEEAGLCYMHAPLFHPAMKNVGPVRMELGMRTFFNMLGPIVNPSKPKRQLSGVYLPEVLELYSSVLQSESMDFAVVHSLDGYDEISLTGEVQVATKYGIEVLKPEDLGLETLTPESLKSGSTIQESADIILNVLNGEATDAQRNVTLANAGMALYASTTASSIQEGIEMAKESLDSGKAMQSFEKFIKIGSN